jgi:uncharacterized protein (DUF58 family)
MGAREYRRGDPLRHVHWKHASKTGKLIVKEFQNEFFVRQVLILDTFVTESQSALFEEAVSVAASLALDLNTQESLLDLLFAGKGAPITSGHGVASVDLILEALATIQPSGEEVFEQLEELALRHIPQAGGCICVFLQWDHKRRELLEQLSQCGAQILALILKEDGGADPENLQIASTQVKIRVLEAGKIEKGLALL